MSPHKVVLICNQIALFMMLVGFLILTFALWSACHAQGLPAYPPAVCVTIAGKPEPCENRQPKRSIAALEAVIIRHDEGGVIKDYVERYTLLKDRFFVIDGDCNSACTMVLGQTHVCATARGRFNFHAASGGSASLGTKWLMDTYPETVRAWINANGGLTKQWLTVRATMFVNKCKEGV